MPHGRSAWFFGRMLPAVVVAVLYFDNHTNLPEYDVLSRGLADMVVTDLTGTPNLEVVERSRLDDVIAELELQRSALFDARTAQKLGRGVGATHALTGAITAVSPRIRIDVRLIEIETGKVKLAKKVVGKPQRFFELEAALVRALAASFGTKAEATTGPKDLATALRYSTAVTLADRGDYRRAADEMGNIMQSDPEFLLAREMFARYGRRMRKAKQKRKASLDEIRTTLTSRMRATIEKYQRPRGPRGELDFNLCARAVLGNLVLSDMKKTLLEMTMQELQPGQIALAPKRRRKEILALHRRFYDEMRAMFDFGAKYRSALHSTGWTVDCHVLAEDRERLHALGVPAPKRLDFSERAVARAKAGYLVFGGPPSYTGYRFTLWPSLAQADPKVAKSALAMVDGKTDADFKARALLMFGRTKEAIDTWQRYLENNPTAKDYERIEHLMERALGLDKQTRSFRAALVDCDSSLADRLMSEAGRVGWAEGPAALPRLVKRVKKKCKKRPNIVRAAYFAAAKEAVFRGECEMFERFAKERPDLAEGHPEDAVAFEDACR